jgi:hypothetical protein
MTTRDLANTDVHVVVTVWWQRICSRKKWHKKLKYLLLHVTNADFRRLCDGKHNYRARFLFLTEDEYRLTPANKNVNIAPISLKNPDKYKT